MDPATAWGIVQVVGTPLVAVGGVAAGFLGKAIGFGAGGVVKGSLAAAAQSSVGNVAAGSVFAMMQSAAAVGGGVAVSSVVGGAVGTLAAGYGVYKFVRGFV